MNTLIRNDIQDYIAVNGPTDSRFVISTFATKYRTTKQRISGNISALVCKQGTLSIHRNRPHSILY